MTRQASATTHHGAGSVFTAFLRLGLTSFGGPIAHLGYFRDEFVSRRRWLGERAYADLLALCQFLPGPASSQVAMAIGLSRAGQAGALAAWAGFTLPSAIALILFALGLSHAVFVLPAGALQGLKCAAAAVVAQAVWSMARSHCRGPVPIGILLCAAALVLWVPAALTQIAVIALAGIAGQVLLRVPPPARDEALPVPITRRVGARALTLFAALLVVLPVLAHLAPGQPLAMLAAFYRVGSLVFGGGHVVLPLLQQQVVPAGWVDIDTFLAGYAAAQAVPGPLFTFAAFLGASAQGALTGWAGGFAALLAIFAPSYLLVVGVLPFWETLRRRARVQGALAGINAAVVGLLVAALYDPVLTSAIHQWRDVALSVAALAALLLFNVRPWVVVAATVGVALIAGYG